ncbi:hypothetical protein RvY_19120 [Ramazzottius varieornatus]|uniref:Uncharacterized protein n=1 Tax=Ramazzottius varieornatus TaxID=947166 RepID=A0A1D1W8B4_RAMVA|nr:hypothetical protein RvY_19120 [Ramazzottius varieornatus]
MADDQLAERFIDLTMQLYDNMMEKCKKNMDPLQDNIELLEGKSGHCIPLSTRWWWASS